jgi:hypothetical protein
VIKPQLAFSGPLLEFLFNDQLHALLGILAVLHSQIWVQDIVDIQAEKGRDLLQPSNGKESVREEIRTETRYPRVHAFLQSIRQGPTIGSPTSPKGSLVTTSIFLLDFLGKVIQLSK